MELSIWDLHHALDHDDMFPSVQTGSATIRFARLISSSHLSDEAVYVCDAREFCASMTDEVLVVHRNDMIFIGSASPEEVFDEICDIIDEFNGWERRLDELVEEEDGLQRMLDASERMLEAPGFVYAPDGRAFAISSAYGPETHWHWAEILANHGMTSAGISRLRDRVNLPEVWRDSYPKTRSSVMGGHGYMHCSLKPNGYMAGHFVLFGFDKPFRRGHERIANTLVKAMTRHMERFYWVYSPTSQIADAFARFLSQGTFDKAEIALFLRALQWDFEDTFRVYIIRERPNEDPVLLPRLLNDILHQFPYVIAFSLDAELVMLENESRSDAHTGIGVQLPSLLGNDFECGVSVARQGVTSCQLLYRQARREVQRCADEAVALSYADENTFDYLMEALRGDSLLPSYAHPGIVRLRHYDLANGTNFYETLRAYTLSSFHLSDTARYLGLHRNSVDYRLKRIREIIDFGDFDALAVKPDENELIELVLSFAVIDAQDA